MSDFTVSATQLDLVSLRTKLEHSASGVCFCSARRVRDHNAGRTVMRVRYNDFLAADIKEGELVVAEVLRRYSVMYAYCVHRIGLLSAGEVSIWVGVCAMHLGAATDACRYILDQVDLRVPVWKKEYYVDGESGWLSSEPIYTYGLVL